MKIVDKRLERIIVRSYWRDLIAILGTVRFDYGFISSTFVLREHRGVKFLDLATTGGTLYYLMSTSTSDSRYYNKLLKYYSIEQLCVWCNGWWDHNRNKSKGVRAQNE